MQRVLVSACLLGQKVRYDGGDKLCTDETLNRWQAEGRVVPFCPEVAGGLPTPRPAAEISGAGGGAGVLISRARVLDVGGTDVTAAFVVGAAAALEQLKAHGIRMAVLKDGSPSCGSTHTYDGSFSGATTAQPGVTAALLRENGVSVFSENEWLEAEAQLERLEAVDQPSEIVQSTVDPSNIKP
jgi:uncharacterized protein YbbK (DUF523 family)